MSVLMRLGVAALTLSAVMGAGVAPVFSQGALDRVTVAAAPRLDFSEAQMALALAVADDPDLAAFYGGNGLRPIFLGPESEARRAALRAGIADAPRHGIPSARYRPETLVADADDLADDLADELAHARALSRLLRDLTGGVLDPGRVDPEIKRRPDRAAMARLLARFQAASDPAAVLADAAPRHPAPDPLLAPLGGA